VCTGDGAHPPSQGHGEASGGPSGLASSPAAAGVRRVPSDILNSEFGMRIAEWKTHPLPPPIWEGRDFTGRLPRVAPATERRGCVTRGYYRSAPLGRLIMERRWRF
jgi:hypothetical protein